MVENQENQGQAGNNELSGGQTDSPSNQQNSQGSGDGFSGQEVHSTTKSSQSGDGVAGTQTAKADQQTGDPGRTPGKAEGEDDSSAES